VCVFMVSMSSDAASESGTDSGASASSGSSASSKEFEVVEILAGLRLFLLALAALRSEAASPRAPRSAVSSTAVSSLPDLISDSGSLSDSESEAEDCCGASESCTTGCGADTVSGAAGDPPSVTSSGAPGVSAVSARVSSETASPDRVRIPVPIPVPVPVSRALSGALPPAVVGSAATAATPPAAWRAAVVADTAASSASGIESSGSSPAAASDSDTDSSGAPKPSVRSVPAVLPPFVTRERVTYFSGPMRCRAPRGPVGFCQLRAAEGEIWLYTHMQASWWVTVYHIGTAVPLALWPVV
jgi:hypothetical protein